VTFWQTLATSSIPALAAIVTIYLTNRHNATLAREQFDQSRKAEVEDRDWEKEQQAERDEKTAEEAKQERKREAIAQAIRSCGDLIGSLVNAKATVKGTLGARPTLDTDALARLPTALYTVQLEEPSERFRTYVDSALHLVDDAATALRGGGAKTNRVDLAIEELNTLAGVLVEALSGPLKDDWND